MKLKHDFDQYIERRNTDSKKYESGDFKEDVLPMWIADTDFKSPKEAIEAALKRAEHGVFGYPHDLEEFNEVVVSWMDRRHDWEIKVDDVLFVGGVVHGAQYAIDAFTNPGDKIVCLTPLFGPLQKIVRDNGRHILGSEMIEDDGYYKIDFEDLEIKLKDPRVSMFILCNPHNPVGRVFTREELEKIGKLCLENDVLIFNDEVHGDIVLFENKHVPIPSVSREISQISITGINPGKTFNVGGMRTAAVIIENPKIREKFLIAREKFRGEERSIFGQNMFIACYRDCEYYVDQMLEYIEGNIEYVEEYMKKNIEEISFKRPEGMYLLWLDCRKLNLEQEDLMKLFEKEGKIGMNDGRSFGEEGRGFVRLNIAVPRVTLEEAMKRIERAVRSLR